MGLLPQGPSNKNWFIPSGVQSSKTWFTSLGTPPNILSRTFRILLACFACITVIGVPLSYRWINTHILPGIYIDSISVGEKTRDEAVALLKKRGLYTLPTEITAEFEGATFTISTKELELTQNPDAVIDEALYFGKQDSWAKNLSHIAQLILQDKHLHVARDVRRDVLQSWIDAIAKQIDKPGKKPTFSLKTSGAPESLVVFTGTEGREVQKDIFQDAILAAINNTSKPSIDPINIPVERITKLTPEQIVFNKKWLTWSVGEKVTFLADDTPFTLNDQKIISMYSDFDLSNTHLNDKEVEKTVLQWASTLERAIQEPSITVVGKEVTAFTPPRNGRSLDSASAKEMLRDALECFARGCTISDPISLPIVSVEPKTKLENLNSLGIKERIGVAVTTFYHSIPGRVHNVALSGKNINLEVVPPGGVFSYNKAVGDVSSATGFQPAYVISEGRTVLGDGGGVCQGSTTLFRAALNAGLPIIERRGHSYRVGYYEQNSLPGIDATAFAPSPDLKFSNDTPGSILVTAAVDEKNYSMLIEFWGTLDGRVATITNHRVFDQTPAKATIYQDDPSLPVGTTRQVDWSAPGAKTSFHYTVKRGENVLQDRVFTTVYQSWAAVYLRGTRQ